ncbi:MAG: amidohydrolase family protein [Sciscionella sp.]
MIVDAHQHIWDRDAADYPWLSGAAPELARSHAMSEVRDARAACGIEATVLVQAANNREDTQTMLAAAEAPVAGIAGVVAWVALDTPDAAIAVRACAADPRVVGVRHLVHDEPDPDWLLRPDVLRGLALLADTGLAFDLPAAYPRHLPHLPAMLRAAPGLRVVIDHLGKPPIAAAHAGFPGWARALREAAALPGVHAKISGLATEAAPDATVDELRPWVEHAVEVFGPARLMLGSDWPVSAQVAPFGAIYAVLRECIAGLSRDERADIEGGTAARCYRLPGAAR